MRVFVSVQVSLLPKLTYIRAVKYQVHKEKERSFFCQTCRQVVCTLCVIEEHSKHDLVEADVLYKKNVDEIRDLETAIDSKVKRQCDVKAKIETMRQQILQSYQKVGIIQHMVTNVIL